MAAALCRSARMSVARPAGAAFQSAMAQATSTGMTQAQVRDRSARGVHFIALNSIRRGLGDQHDVYLSPHSVHWRGSPGCGSRRKQISREFVRKPHVSRFR
jgi:hypothetical protein